MDHSIPGGCTILGSLGGHSLKQSAIRQDRYSEP
jgi:hypothetical protein